VLKRHGPVPDERQAEGGDVNGVPATTLVETAIGLIFVWFLSASLCSGIFEAIGAALGFRATHLWRALGQALGAPDAPVERGPAIVEAAQLTSPMRHDRFGQAGGCA
jgi:hypothetical protein